MGAFLFYIVIVFLACTGAAAVADLLEMFMW